MKEKSLWFQSIPLSKYPLPSIFQREILVKLFQKGMT
jgi:hypothetical protein